MNQSIPVIAIPPAAVDRLGQALADIIEAMRSEASNRDAGLLNQALDSG